MGIKKTIEYNHRISYLNENDLLNIDLGVSSEDKFYMLYDDIIFNNVLWLFILGIILLISIVV